VRGVMRAGVTDCRLSIRPRTVDTLHTWRCIANAAHRVSSALLTSMIAYLLPLTAAIYTLYTRIGLLREIKLKKRHYILHYIDWDSSGRIGNNSETCLWS